MLVIAALAGCASDPGQGPRPERPAAQAARETPGSGLVARLPYVGTLTWRCDAEGRFFTRLTLPRPGAGVIVGLTADGERVWGNRLVNPAPAPKRTVVGPFQALRRQTWTIRYHHKPATVRVRARLRFAARPARGTCVVSRTNVEVRRIPH